MNSYPKKAAKGAPAKQIESHNLMWGEPVQLKGGLGVDRKFTRQYKPGAADPESYMPLPAGMLNVR